jgi:hypothetical protein
VKKTIILLAALAHSSCAPPQAIIIAEETIKEPSGVPEKPALVNDGLRLPDMTKLPDDNDLRSMVPLKKDSNATIISRPPTE